MYSSFKKPILQVKEGAGRELKLMEEVERLKGLIKTMYSERLFSTTPTKYHEANWKAFKTLHNL